MKQIFTDGFESNQMEFKRELTANFEREIVAFLNSHNGGLLYFGVNADGEVVGLDLVDDVQLKIVDRIKNNILPTTLGLFDVFVESFEGKKVVKVIVSSGVEKPYYLRKYGMSPAGCFSRVGSSAQPLTTQQIDSLYANRMPIRLGNIPSPRQKLTFNLLKIYYAGKGLELNDEFETSLDLLDEKGRYNYVAYLLADENGVSIKVAKYAGTDKVDLIENEEYGYCCLIKATDRVLDKLIAENRTFAKITPKTRLERKMVDPSALKEAFINAIIHNDYTHEVPPVVEIFSDRITITSYGGLPQGLSRENFFRCRSMPRNRELMRIFKDNGMVEHLGSGMGRILKAYDKSIFNFEDNFLIVTFPFAPGFALPNDKSNGNTNGSTNGNTNGNAKEEMILESMRLNPQIRINDIVSSTGISKRTISRVIKKLQEAGIIRHVGSSKTGQWEVLL